MSILEDIIVELDGCPYAQNQLLTATKQMVRGVFYLVTQIAYISVKC